MNKEIGSPRIVVNDQKAKRPGEKYGGARIARMKGKEKEKRNFTKVSYLYGGKKSGVLHGKKKNTASINEDTKPRLKPQKKWWRRCQKPKG